MDAFSFVITTLLILSFAYLGVAIFGVWWFAQRLNKNPKLIDRAPVTILKPICGSEPGLLENLRSFCEQDFAAYQVVFGVRDPNDPAIDIVYQLIGEYPAKDLSLVIDEHILGQNLKVSNLANMFRVARHDIILVSDSDMRVGPQYLAAVISAFDDDGVGAATCLYSGSANKNIASRLGAMFINDWFLPSALIPMLFVELKYCFGATMAIRRDVLKSIGGFEALVDVLADDYMLGHKIFNKGRRIALVPYVVENIVVESGFKTLFDHETRWARTIRSVKPVGYFLSLVTETFSLSIIAGLVFYANQGSAVYAVLPIVIALALRSILHYSVQTEFARESSMAALWLIPLRELFSLMVRIYSFFGQNVSWRGQKMTVRNNSRLENIINVDTKKMESCDEKNAFS
ncbi:MAG: hypothetical protein CBB68_11965 [Rhodospirillaceae bacterium TMED8]|nr:hypothetical protein [Magnetovibrio sp.]OUT49281.1 MAG: hypothetical protein CBB68_11965 [Rhodospirillaceae bacterium TMED8]|tara:strand:+ start:1833 stop:3038 length:1206 start_codon:yes stop_codon:yes gene_type:complete